MRRLLLLGALCAMSVLASAPAAWATSYVYGSCAEMPTQELAQGTLDDPYYSTSPATAFGPAGDELKLDPDGDGVACNDPGNTIGGESQPGGNADLDCADFGSREEAQAALDEGPQDPSGLDADGDGIACEELFSASPTEAAPTTQQYEQSSDVDCIGLVESSATAAQPGTGPGLAQERAQAILNEDPTDPNGLDADGDGVACEFTEGSSGEVTFEDGGRFAEIVDSAEPPVSDGGEECEDIVAQTGRRISCEPFQEAPVAQEAPETRRELPATGGSGFLLLALAGGAIPIGLVALKLGSRRRPV